MEWVIPLRLLQKSIGDRKNVGSFLEPFLIIPGQKRAWIKLIIKYFPKILYVRMTPRSAKKIVIAKLS